MTPSGFQLVSETAPKPKSKILSFGISNTEVQTILCGVCLRGWLTDVEKEALDRLTPEMGITFLSSDGKYLHPEDVDLFSLEDLAEVAGQSKGAVFSRGFSGQAKGNPERDVQTAVISPDSSRTVMLGMICPHRVPGEISQADEFGRTVLRFREEFKHIAGALGLLEEVLDSGDLTLVVDRSSGRILAASAITAPFLGMKQRQLVGTEFSKTKELLAKKLGLGKLSLKNMSAASLSLSVFSLKPSLSSVSPDGPAPKTPEMPSRHFVHQLRNTASGLLMAVSHFKNVNSEIDAASHEVMDLMDREVGLLCDQIDTIDALLNFDALRPVSVDLKAEIRQAVDRVKIVLPPFATLHHCEDIEPGILSLPTGVLSSFVQAIIRSHWNEVDASVATVINYEIGENNQSVITVHSDYSHSDYPAAFNRDWLEYVTVLGTRLSHRLCVEQMQTRRKLITRLNLISPQRG